jgi:integrase
VGRVPGGDRGPGPHLKTMRRNTALPPLAKQARVRGRKPHDPKFDVREALYIAQVAELMGHISTEMVSSVYGHLAHMGEAAKTAVG